LGNYYKLAIINARCNVQKSLHFINHKFLKNTFESFNLKILMLLKPHIQNTLSIFVYQKQEEQHEKS